MRRLRAPACTILSLSVAALLAGCGSDRGEGIDLVVIGEPQSLYDAGTRLSAGAQLLRAATAQGLVALDQQGQVVPGLADRWIVTDDGLSYIFRLNDGSWAGGGKISAASARTALAQALTGLRGTALGKDLAAIEEIRVMTGRVIEIRLSRPQPDLLLLLAQPELGLLNRGKGAGPMALRRDGKVAYLNAIDPAERGLAAVGDWKEQTRQLRLRALDAEAAMARFDAGETDAVLGGRYEAYPLAGSGVLSRGALRLDPVAGLFGLALVHGDGFLADPRNREAVAKAIDRAALPAALGIGGWALTERILPIGLDDAPQETPVRWEDQSLEQRQSEAAAQVARWRGADRDPVRLRIAMPAGPGSERLFARLAEDLGKAGLAAVRVGMGDAADLRLIDVVARYPRAPWYFNQLSCGVLPGPCSSEADARAAKAREASDPAERAALYAEAEASLLASNAYIPLGAPIRWSLLRGNASGFAINRFGTHPLMPMAMRPK